ncbi:MAG: hypothetical protein M3N53_02635 [Actinomycetota bacterium]|nr:hypothetical protein [Actinomycetota bacterium]
MKKISLCLALLVLAGVACADDRSLSDMELRLVSGIVNVIRDGETIAVENRLELEPGDVIVTEADSLARFALAGGPDVRHGEMQGGGKVVVTSTTSVEAETGELLMQVADATRVTVDGVTGRASEAAFRVDRGFGSVRAAVYTGQLNLDAPGQTDVTLPTLFQATIVAGDLPTQTRPYRLDVKDPWDQSLLEDVVTLEEQLALLARGLGNQLGRERPSLGYFSALINGGNVDFMKPYLRREPADLLIGFTIARNADGSLRRGFQSAFGLFDQGARWGVAAKIMRVETQPVVAQLERIILGTGVVAAKGNGKAAFTVAAAAASETGGAVAPTFSGPTAAAEGNDPPEPQEPQEPDDPDNPEKPKPPPPDECGNTAECAFEDVEDQLPPQPSPSPSPTDQQTGLLDGGLD